MEYRNFGDKKLKVSALGFGAGQIGEARHGDDWVGWFLNYIVDQGVTLIDTARSYGLSEDRIGRHLSWRRKDFVLSTKLGYSVPNTPDWSEWAVTKGVEEALRTMRTDYIDIVHLHSCSLEHLQRGEVIEALEKAKQSGKVRLIAYSGENEALEYAAHCQRFDSLQCSINFCDQRALFGPARWANENGMGVIAKRPIANAPWRFSERPHGNYAETYWLRMKTMNLPDFGIEWNELALRFSLFSESVSSCIVGTTDPNNLDRNLKVLEKGPLSQDILDIIWQAFADNDQDWRGDI
jgi:aryl-alcohol dehydrogenase-like predicted oxidoreductase